VVSGTSGLIGDVRATFKYEPLSQIVGMFQLLIAFFSYFSVPLTLAATIEPGNSSFVHGERRYRQAGRSGLQGLAAGSINIRWPRIVLILIS
jgi:hypothetical protein